MLRKNWWRHDVTKPDGTGVKVPVMLPKREQEQRRKSFVPTANEQLESKYVSCRFALIESKNNWDSSDAQIRHFSTV